MKNRSNDAQRMIQLTLSNAVDQTQKIRVEVPMGTNIKQATEDAGLAPSSTFDVFTAEGEVVTAHPVDQYSDNTLYVGPQKVAGGAWGDEDFELKPEDGVQTLTEPPEKAIVFTSAFDSTIRNEVVPQPDQTVKAAAQMAGLAPRDGSAWQVFDAIGEIVEDRPAQEYAGDLLYVGPQAIVGGDVMLDVHPTGIELNEIAAARSDFPSLKAVAGHRIDNRIQMMWVKIPDNRGWTNQSHFECIVDVRDQFKTYVLNVGDQKGHPRLYRKQAIPGTSQSALIVCSGDWSTRMGHFEDGHGSRLSAYLNHVINLLNV